MTQQSKLPSAKPAFIIMRLRAMCVCCGKLTECDVAAVTGGTGCFMPSG
jgi:hypothetical protein